MSLDTNTNLKTPDQFHQTQTPREEQNGSNIAQLNKVNSQIETGNSSNNTSNTNLDNHIAKTQTGGQPSAPQTDQTEQKSEVNTQKNQNLTENENKKNTNQNKQLITQNGNNQKDTNQSDAAATSPATGQRRDPPTDASNRNKGAVKQEGEGGNNPQGAGQPPPPPPTTNKTGNPAAPTNNASPVKANDNNSPKTVDIKGLKAGMGVSWGVVAAGIAAAATTLVLSIFAFPAIPLFAILIPAGVALAASIPAITTTVLVIRENNIERAKREEAEIYQRGYDDKHPNPSTQNAQSVNNQDDDDNAPFLFAGSEDDDQLNIPEDPLINENDTDEIYANGFDEFSQPSATAHNSNGDGVQQSTQSNNQNPVMPNSTPGIPENQRKPEGGGDNSTKP